MYISLEDVNSKVFCTMSMISFCLDGGRDMDWRHWMNVCKLLQLLSLLLLGLSEIAVGCDVVENDDNDNLEEDVIGRMERFFGVVVGMTTVKE